MPTYDLAVIGAGPGGYVAAIRAAQLGLKVTLVEKGEALGGTCLNVGCIPSKALLESSELYWLARRGFGDHGISAGALDLDLERMMSRKIRIVKELTGGIGMLMKKHKITVVRGLGVPVGERRVAVRTDEGEEAIEAANVVLATGSVPLEIPAVPFDGRNVVSSTEALCLDRVPGHLVVVGAGAVGLELGSVWSRLGARVTFVEMLPGIVPFADVQVAKMLQRSLEEQGMSFQLGSKVVDAESSGKDMNLTVEDEKGNALSVTCDKVLVAVGRRPCTEGMDLGKIGVKLDDNGRVLVDETFQTSVPGIYAIGDLIRGPMLAHKASEEGVAVVETIAGLPGHVNYAAIPSVVYTSPELAQVGRTERQLEEEGVSFTSGRFYFKANGRAKCMGEEMGMVKILAHAETDQLLGVHVLGPRASELIAEAVIAIEFEATAEELGGTAHAHPSLSEAMKEAALGVGGRAIHR
jgi:dihydrolipoamide dehydrogenase